MSKRVDTGSLELEKSVLVLEVEVFCVILERAPKSFHACPKWDFMGVPK